MARFVEHKFRGEDVELDGGEFQGCSFFDCRLIIRGTAPFVFSTDNSVQLSSIIFSDHAATTLCSINAILSGPQGELQSMILRRLFGESPPVELIRKPASQ